MTCKQARQLRDEIRATGIYATVPTGMHTYFARIWSSRGLTSGSQAVDFYTREQWLEWKAKADKQDLAAKIKSRSPIEIMIDRACGLEAQ